MSLLLHIRNRGRGALRRYKSKLYCIVLICNRNRNRNLKTSKALLKSQAHQGISLFTNVATYQRGFSRRVVTRSSGPISRIPGEDRVAVKVGVVQMERVHDQMGQGRSV